MRNKNVTKVSGAKFLNLHNEHLAWKVHFSGDWVDTKRRRWKAVGGPKKKREGMLTFDNAGCRQFQCQWGFPRRTCPNDCQSCVLLNIMFVVGRQAVNVSSCTNINLYLTQANICREDKAAMLHLEPSSVGHLDKRWLVPHFPTATASVSRTTSCRSSVPACNRTQRRVSVKVKRSVNRERM